MRTLAALLAAAALASAGDLQDSIDALKAPRPEWRRIGWKTCLLDALHASRDGDKPVIAWMFIDRPVDDERC